MTTDTTPTPTHKPDPRPMTTTPTLRLAFSTADKLTRIVPKAGSRYALDVVGIRRLPGDGDDDGAYVAEATDGHCLARIPLEKLEGSLPAPDARVYVTRAAWDAATKGRKGARVLEVHDHGAAVVLKDPATGTRWDGTVPDDTKDRPYPPFDDLLRTVAKTAKYRGTVSVTLNPTMLLDLAKAMASDGTVTLTVPLPKGGTDVTDPVEVQVSSHPDRVGVIMPIAPNTKGGRR